MEIKKYTDITNNININKADTHSAIAIKRDALVVIHQSPALQP